jgi:hypothetical protein
LNGSFQFLKENSAEIFGLNKQADGFWRIKTNEVLDKLPKRKNEVGR